MNTAASRVSCIMPTYNRRSFIPGAIRYFLRQDYAQKELIIIDDGEDAILDLVPDRSDIRYVRLEKKVTLGEKLNMGCELAGGEILMHWDDDDWYAPHRISYQAAALLDGHVDVCGINHLLYYDIRTQQAFKYKYPSDQRPWLLGSSLCYTRQAWSRHRFAEINVGMDGLFVWSIPPGKVKALEDNTMAVHMIHDNNVSPKQTSGPLWHPSDTASLEQLMGADWHQYNGKHENTTLLKNVYACLVHEDEGSVRDMVANLRYHDPHSPILLYNGSGHTNFVRPDTFFQHAGVIHYPTPRKMKWGALHQFALDTMAYVVGQMNADIITFVDSDQLALRSGYCRRQEAVLRNCSSVGMLGSCDHVIGRHEDNPPAMQAFLEYELWKPLLRQFKHGEAQFVHWTFWPSTVFTRDAARDLVQLFKTNTTLQGIMQRSQIWATEEIILPTLVKLLGYDIGINPCSYDYVQFRKSYSVEDVAEAIGDPDNYWIHPVPRTVADPLRRYLRQRYDHYGVDAVMEAPANDRKLLSAISRIGGRLSDAEAMCLSSCVLQAGMHDIVETGSYHGKATVLMGTAIRLHGLKATITAIDHYNGKAARYIRYNIREAGLEEVITVIDAHLSAVEWKEQISLLLINGLPDSYHHFESWIRAGGLVAFHGGRQDTEQLIGELLTDAYQEFAKADSLIVLQKKV